MRLPNSPWLLSVLPRRRLDLRCRYHLGCRSTALQGTQSHQSSSSCPCFVALSWVSRELRPLFLHSGWMPLWLPSLRVAGKTCFPGDPERGCFVQTAGAAVVSMGLAEVLQVLSHGSEAIFAIPVHCMPLMVHSNDVGSSFRDMAYHLINDGLTIALPGLVHCWNKIC